MKVAAKQCKTCIYRPASPLDIRELESQVADPYMEGSFKGHRICHHFENAADDDVCCRGFWDRHKNNFNLGRIAQRLNCVKFIGENT